MTRIIMPEIQETEDVPVEKTKSIVVSCTINEEDKEYEHAIKRECYKKIFYEIIEYLETSPQDTFTLTFNRETDRMIFERSERFIVNGRLYPGYTPDIPLAFPSTTVLDEIEHSIPHFTHHSPKHSFTHRRNRLWP
jgi:hypothetical protein